MSAVALEAASVPAPAPARRRRWWPWILGLCLAPFVALGLVVWSFLTLDRDAAALRGAAMSAAPAAWKQKVVLDLGGFTFGGLRTVAGWVQAPHMNQVRHALQATRAVSVGVYQRTTAAERVSPAAFMAATDAAMTTRGWTRLVGVVDAKESVVIYVPAGNTEGAQLDICLAVVHARELVVVKARVQAEALGELIAASPMPWKRGVLAPPQGND